MRTQRACHETLASVQSRLASQAARRLFSKAMIASLVAKLALNSRSRRSAYKEKSRNIAAALRICPILFRIWSDHECRRWVVCLKNGPALHWRRLEEAIQ
jgi:hypothetical protein